MPCWDTKCGDLCFINKKLEVKGFTTNAPSSFGATESWNWIYFVDCKDTLNKHFKIYEITPIFYVKVGQQLVLFSLT